MRVQTQSGYILQLRLKLTTRTAIHNMHTLVPNLPVTSWLQLARNVFLSTFKALHDCQYTLSDYPMLVLPTLNVFLSMLNDFLFMLNDFLSVLNDLLSLLNVCMLWKYISQHTQYALIQQDHLMHFSQLPEGTNTHQLNTSYSRIPQCLLQSMLAIPTVCGTVPQSTSVVPKT